MTLLPAGSWPHWTGTLAHVWSEPTSRGKTEDPPLVDKFPGSEYLHHFQSGFWWRVNCALFIAIWRSQFRGNKSELAMKTWSKEKISMLENVTDFECTGNETYFNISADPGSCLIFNWLLLYRQVRGFYQFTCQIDSLFIESKQSRWSRSHPWLLLIK